MTRISARVVPVPDLSPAQLDAMHALLDRYYAGVKREAFRSDLAEKQWAILLEANGELVGFTTLMTWREDGCGLGHTDSGEVLVLFSGDTIVDSAHRRQTALMSTWATLAATLIEEADVPGYWFLICGGYKTYRFLPLFLRDYHPRLGSEQDERLLRLLDTCARRKFGSRWDREAGVVRLGDGVQLQPGVADVDERRLADPHVRLFVERNPGHSGGDELACIARFSSDNLTGAGRLFHPSGEPA